MEIQEYEITPELTEAVKEVVDGLIGWKKLWSAYFEHNEGKTLDDEPLTETDLVREILESGGYLHEEDHAFEDMVMIGAHIMGEDFNIFEEEK